MRSTAITMLKRQSKTSYSELWLEIGGEKHRRGWYKLPANEIKKSLEEVKASTGASLSSEKA